MNREAPENRERDDTYLAELMRALKAARVAEPIHKLNWPDLTAAAEGELLMIRQIRSKAGCPRKQREILVTLGLRRINHEVLRPNNATTRGCIAKVRHLVDVRRLK
jgi:large subunit ribosomal protein L30